MEKTAPKDSDKTRRRNKALTATGMRQRSWDALSGAQYDYMSGTQYDHSHREPVRAPMRASSVQSKKDMAMASLYGN
eukprot:COSAG05_NODE_76_length_21413_cov_40.065122_13_plen_77_part_00